MKLENLSRFDTEDENGDSALQRIQKSFRLGLTSDPVKEAQMQVLDSLKKMLDDRFTLFWNLQLDNAPEPVPFVLVGPPGVTAIYVSTAKGVFRANGEEWNILDNRGNDFRPSKPNLTKKALAFSRAVENVMLNYGIQGHEVDSVLVMMDPGTHVETVRPVSRVVLMDAVEPFAARLNRTQPTLRREEGTRIINLLMDQGYKVEEPDRGEEPILLGGGDEFTEFEKEEQTSIEATLEKFQKKFKFSKKQWMIVLFLVIGDAILLIAAVIVFYMLASALR